MRAHAFGERRAYAALRAESAGQSCPTVVAGLSSTVRLCLAILAGQSAALLRAVRAGGRQPRVRWTF